MSSGISLLKLEERTIVACSPKGGLLIRERYQLHEDQNGVCHYCKKWTPLEKWTLEHKTPVSRGGTSHHDNKVGACYICNSLKACLTEEEYAVVKDDHSARKTLIRYHQDCIAQNLATKAKWRWSSSEGWEHK